MKISKTIKMRKPRVSDAHMAAALVNVTADLGGGGFLAGELPAGGVAGEPDVGGRSGVPDRSLVIGQ
jgi:hypothetical protein